MDRHRQNRIGVGYTATQDVSMRGAYQGNPRMGLVIAGFTHALESRDVTAIGIAQLVVHFDTDQRAKYDLYQAGAGVGTFVSREFRNSLLHDSDSRPFIRAHG